MLSRPRWLIRTNDFRMLLNFVLFCCASKSASSFLSSATNGNSAGYWEENYDVIQNKMTEEDKIHRKMILHPVILLLQHVLLWGHWTCWASKEFVWSSLEVQRIFVFTKIENSLWKKIRRFFQHDMDNLIHRNVKTKTQMIWQKQIIERLPSIHTINTYHIIPNGTTTTAMPAVAWIQAIIRLLNNTGLHPTWQDALSIITLNPNRLQTSFSELYLYGRLWTHYNPREEEWWW